jgi:PII-like signaling protein
MPVVRATRLTLHLPGGSVWKHKPLYAEVVHRAHRRGLAGASVFHGVEGFGAHLTVHEDHPARLVEHGPCVVVIIDADEAVRAFLGELADILAVTGAAVLSPVEVHRPG